MTSAETLMGKISDMILNPLIGLMFGLALAYFIWGVIQFIAGAANEDAREQGRKHIMWGVIGLVVMTAVWGIIDVMVNFWQGI
jgi:zinc transporter ZupT